MDRLVFESCNVLTSRMCVYKLSNMYQIIEIVISILYPNLINMILSLNDTNVNIP